MAILGEDNFRRDDGRPPEASSLGIPLFSQVKTVERRWKIHATTP